jgi:hypothetical protein
MTDIAGDLDLNTRAQMKRDCFNKMMSESLWPVEDEEFDEDGDDTLA